ncbi:hypothetical protein KKG41_04605 [Patescibacteria group bacterium]|nr:hypothetical protein [Patescibacteria group bacterium]MBU1890844.1 hypothetical protein [Patescibacteria group bacterium]
MSKLIHLKKKKFAVGSKIEVIFFSLVAIAFILAMVLALLNYDTEPSSADQPASIVTTNMRQANVNVSTEKDYQTEILELQSEYLSDNPIISDDVFTGENEVALYKQRQVVLNKTHQKVLNLSVPKEYQSLHLSIAQIYSQLSAITDSMIESLKYQNGLDGYSLDEAKAIEYRLAAEEQTVATDLRIESLVSEYSWLKF